MLSSLLISLHHILSFFVRTLVHFIGIWRKVWVHMYDAIMIIKSGFRRLSITKYTTDWLLCHYHYIESISCDFLWCVVKSGFRRFSITKNTTNWIFWQTVLLSWYWVHQLCFLWYVVKSGFSKSSITKNTTDWLFRQTVSLSLYWVN
jgi:hypothetical protein